MYEAFFGLSGKPFQLNPDPDFYFASKGHKRARAYLEYGLHQGEGFIVITGEVGAGKTTLLRGLLQRLPGDSIVATQIVSTQVDAEDLLRLVAQGFGLQAEGVDKSTLLTELRRHCLQEHERGKRMLLIVDEAQNLPPRAVEELRMLSNFQVGNRSLVQSFLVGQPELRDMMQQPEMRQLKQRVIASYHLGPLDAEDTKSYVEHRLRHVGWSGDPSFTDTAFERIHALSGGIPRRINGLCDRLLLACYLSAQHDVSAALVQQVADEASGEVEFAGPRRAGMESLSRPGPPAHPLEPAARVGRKAGLQGSLEHGLNGSEAMADRLDELDERISVLESGQHMLQMRLKRILRLLERNSGNIDSDT